MEEFKRKLKRLDDIEFSRIKSKYRNKVDNKSTISSAANNIKIYGDDLKDTSDKITSITNKLYPDMGITKDSATKILKEQLEKYMIEIKKLSRF